MMLTIIERFICVRREQKGADRRIDISNVPGQKSKTAARALLPRNSLLRFELHISRK